MAERKIDSFNDFRSEEKPPALEVPAWCAPNIADLARRAGLPADISPYDLAVFRNALFLRQSGNSIASVTSFALESLGRLVEDARGFARRFPDVKISDVRATYPDLGFLPDEWITSVVLRGHHSDDRAQVKREINAHLQHSVPDLQKWPPPEFDNRPLPVRQGETVALYYEELQKMRCASRPTFLSEEELRQRFPGFEIWKEIGKMKLLLRTELFNPGPNSLGDAQSIQLFECIGSICGKAGETVQGWYKAYRAFSGLKRRRRKK